MKTRILLTIMLLAIAPNVHSQKIKGFASAIKFGYLTTPGSASVFTKISKTGIDGFSNNYAAFGGESYYRKGKLIFGLEGNIGAQDVYSSGIIYAEPALGSGHLRFGYILSSSDRYWFYPSYGAGFSVIALTTYNKISDVKKSFSNSAILMSPSFDLGMNVDFILNKVNAEKKCYGTFLLGIRAGFRTSFSHDNWFDDEGFEIKNMPSYGNNAFYLMLSIGAGCFWKKM